MSSNPVPMELDSPYTKGRFKGKVSIVTGGASGIGRATVQRFVNDGAAVAVFDINQSAGEQLVTELRDAGHDVSFYNVDVSSKSQCIEAVKTFADEHGGKIHLLVNNAGIRGDQGLDATKADWDRVLGVNTVGYSNMVQSCYPFMKNWLTAGQWECAVVNVASCVAYRGVSSWTYQASKGAIIALTKCMALDLSASCIRVNSISPAHTWTDLQTAVTGGDRQKWEPIVAKSEMLRRFCEPEEIAAGIAFLCSRDASFITGIDLPVDGGYLALTPEGLSVQD